MTLSMSPAVSARYDALVKLLTKRGGVRLTELGDAHALARELEADAPDPERVEEFTRRLGLGPEEVEGQACLPEPEVGPKEARK